MDTMRGKTQKQRRKSKWWHTQKQYGQLFEKCTRYILINRRMPRWAHERCMGRRCVSTRMWIRCRMRCLHGYATTRRHGPGV